MPKQVFIADNIVAILKAAKDGGNTQSVLERSGTGVHIGTLAGWVTRGHRESHQGQTNPYTKFADKWDEARADRSMSSQRRNAAEEMDKALMMLEEE